MIRKQDTCSDAVREGALLFTEYLKKEDYAHNTILTMLSSYQLYFSLFETLSCQNLKLYRQYLIDHYKASTVNSRLNSINRCLDWISRLNFEEYPQIASLYCQDACQIRLTAVKIQTRAFLDTVISQADYTEFKDVLKAEGNLFWYFVVRFLACTGARVSELITIKAEHLELGYMDLCSKGGKVRRIYFPPQLCIEARKWLHDRGITSGFIFTGRNGRPLTARGIGSQLKVLAHRYGIPEETVYPHSFRHLFAKNFLARYQDISLLADLLGHESIQTTRIYLMQTCREQRETIDRLVTW